MSFRQSILAPLDSVRSILGPDGLDMRRTTCTIRTRSYPSGRRNSRDPYVDSDLALNPWYRIRQVTTREVATSGGRLQSGDVIIEQITPSDGNGVGYTQDQLAPPVPKDGADVYYVLQSEDPSDGINGEYTRREIRRDANLHFVLILTRRTRAQGT